MNSLSLALVVLAISVSLAGLPPIPSGARLVMEKPISCQSLPIVPNLILRGYDANGNGDYEILAVHTVTNGAIGPVRAILYYQLPDEARVDYIMIRFPNGRVERLSREELSSRFPRPCDLWRIYQPKESA